MTRRAWLLFAAMCVIWGIPYLLIKVAVGELDPAVVVFGRSALGAVLLLPLALARKQVLPVIIAELSAAVPPLTLLALRRAGGCAVVVRESQFRFAFRQRRDPFRLLRRCAECRDQPAAENHAGEVRLDHEVLAETFHQD